MASPLDTPLGTCGAAQLCHIIAIFSPKNLRGNMHVPRTFIWHQHHKLCCLLGFCYQIHLYIYVTWHEPAKFQPKCLKARNFSFPNT
jgi:hypothetical protein